MNVGLRFWVGLGGWVCFVVYWFVVFLGFVGLGRLMLMWFWWIFGCCLGFLGCAGWRLLCG